MNIMARICAFVLAYLRGIFRVNTYCAIFFGLKLIMSHLLSVLNEIHVIHLQHFGCKFYSCTLALALEHRNTVPPATDTHVLNMIDSSISTNPNYFTWPVFDFDVNIVVVYVFSVASACIELKILCGFLLEIV